MTLQRFLRSHRHDAVASDNQKALYVALHKKSIPYLHIEFFRLPSAISGVCQ